MGINVSKFNYYAGSKGYQQTFFQAPALGVTQHSLFSLIVLFCPTLESSVPTFFAYGWLFSPYLHLLCTLLLTP